ncbi:MAG: LytTR family DNA-binding domain-containing protein [Clostridia bacterium]|nr:LytTR family DNA-binding domain-containing protein [Clostridia bacterium]
MRIALCDDEPVFLAEYRRAIARWAEQSGEPCDVSAFQSADALLFETQGQYPFDLMLLDVEMPGMDGLALARRIRRTDERVRIAFLTQHTDYLFEGYEVGALRYVLKRQAEGKLPALLDEVRAKLARAPNYLLVNVQGECVKLEAERILFVEAQGHDTLVHLTEGTLALRTPFARFAESLPAGFAAAHRSYVVNLAHVERLSRAQCLLAGGASVPVSRACYAPLNRAFLAYYRGMID